MTKIFIHYFIYLIILIKKKVIRKIRIQRKNYGEWFPRFETLLYRFKKTHKEIRKNEKKKERNPLTGKI